MSYTALYRKHRPINFDEVVGQDHIIKTLKNQIIANRVGHAYLLNGTRGTGKTSTAKVLARAINCLNNKDGNPCNECEICKASLNGSLTDIVEMDAASNNSVDDVRAIRDEVSFLPTVAKYRVYIIDEVHMLSIGAFNALLKTLEEPPEHVKFILATTEPQKLPATILSRCQRFDFKKIPVSYIKSRILEICNNDNIDIDEDAINTISVYADGALRDGLSILERCLQEGTGKITKNQVKDLVGVPKIEFIYNLVKNILKYNIIEAMKIVDDILDDGKDIINFTWEIIRYVKDILVYKTTKKLDIYSEEEIKQIDELANIDSKERLLNIIFSLSDLLNELRMTNQTTIMFQVNIMRLCDNILINEEKTNMSVSNANYDEIKTLNNRIDKIELTLKEIINRSRNSVNNSNTVITEDKKVDVKKNTKLNANLQNLMTNQFEGKNVECWGKIVSDLKESGKVMLYSSLAKSHAIELNDMTIGIGFPEGLTPFGQSVIGTSENISEINKMLSMQYGKSMQVRIISDLNGKSKNDTIDSFVEGLDLPLNIID